MWDVLTSFDPALLLAFIGAGLLLNFTPGADFVFISASGIAGGPRIGMAAGIGVLIGVAVHIIAASAGVSALLLAYPATYDAIIRFSNAGKYRDNRRDSHGMAIKVLDVPLWSSRGGP